MINGPVWNPEILQDEGEAPTILAVGDSWFWYLNNNLLNPLYRILNKYNKHIILAFGANGAEAAEYDSGPIFAQIKSNLNPIEGYGKTIKAVFLSGGGNDLAGVKDFTKILRPDCSAAYSPEQCLKEGEPEQFFNAVTAHLLNVVSEVDRCIPGTPVFIHGYDYANPNGKGFLGLGQWLQFPMESCHVNNALHQPLINHLIDAYWCALKEAQAQHPNIYLVDQRGTLQRNEWANELHPTVAGFNKVAECWKHELLHAGLISNI